MRSPREAKGAEPSDALAPSKSTDAGEIRRKSNLEAGTLVVRPSLPAAWGALALSFRFAGQPVRVRADADHVTVTCRAPLTVAVDGEGPTRCPPGTTAIRWTGARPTGERR